MSIVGARPQFIKAAAVSRALAEVGCREFLLHTGQHYDAVMSEIFFDELGVNAPAVNLEVGSGSHGAQTAEMLRGIEKSIQDVSPQLVLVYGDTNSTLAGALAAVKLQTPVAHVEAGARNFSLAIPEEVNRVLTDRISAIRFCATKTNLNNLRQEGINNGILTGDVMFDIFLASEPLARQRRDLLSKHKLIVDNYLLATFHRPSNVDSPDSLEQILLAVSNCGEDVVFPVHPRTRPAIDRLRKEGRVPTNSNVRLIEPVGYLDFLCLELHCRAVLTDSGGVQREAYFAGKRCVSVFHNTAWPETVEEGWNQVVPTTAQAILSALRRNHSPKHPRGNAFGDGKAAKRIARILKACIQAGITADGDNLAQALAVSSTGAPDDCRATAGLHA